MLNKEHFQKEIKRLEDQWPKGYGGQRQFLIWQALRTTNNLFFTEAIDYMLANQRAQPLLPDFEKYERIWKRNQAEQTTQRHADASIVGIMEKAKKYTQADPDIVKAAMKLTRLISYGASTEEKRKLFDEGCGVLYTAIKLRYKPIFEKG